MIDAILAKSKAIKELGAFGVMIVITLAALAFLSLEVRPQLEKVEALAAGQDELTREMAAHRAWEPENYRLAVLQCRAMRELIKRDPDTCGPEAYGPPRQQQQQRPQTPEGQYPYGPRPQELPRHDQFPLAPQRQPERDGQYPLAPPRQQPPTPPVAPYPQRGDSQFGG